MSGLRLLMGPIGYVGVGSVNGRSTDAAMLIIEGRYRWVRELNGHPGHCGPDCWHATPEAALACFEGKA